MYNHAPAAYPCPFCLLLRGVENEHVYSRQSDIVYQNEKVTAFVASHQWPRNHGNILIIPNAHHENIYELPVTLAAEIQRVAQGVALGLKTALRCAGISLRQHNEPAGSQDVWHYHLHVTPRYDQDRFYAGILTERAFMPVEERAHYARLLRDPVIAYLAAGIPALPTG